MIFHNDTQIGLETEFKFWQLAPSRVWAFWASWAFEGTSLSPKKGKSPSQRWGWKESLHLPRQISSLVHVRKNFPDTSAKERRSNMKNVKEVGGTEIQFATTQHDCAKCLYYQFQLPALCSIEETIAACTTLT